MSKFRLAVFNTQPPHLYFGGVERRIMETTKRLTDKANITVYSGTKSGFKKPATIGGVNFSPVTSTDKIYPLDNWMFNQNLTKRVIEADVYEGHNDNGYEILKENKKQGIKTPFIHTIHGVLADEYEQAKKYGYTTFRGRMANQFMISLAKHEAETAQSADLIVTIGEISKQLIIKHYDIEPKKIRIVPNGVDPEKYKPQQMSIVLKDKFGLPDKPIALFVGNLIPRKGLRFLIDAAKTILKENPDTQFVIVGEGPQKNPLIQNIKDAGITKNFKMLGGLKEPELMQIYGCADVFVLPSMQEGQGIVLLEAQASKVPVVAFNIGGVNEAVVNNKTGMLVKPGDSEELATALQKLLQDKTLREKMGAAGREFVLENYTWDLCAQKMLKVYEEALALGH